MITAMATFRLPRPITPEQASAIFQSTAPRYQSVAGLIRKYYVLAEDGATAGGIYLWRSRADAEALYTDDWKAFVREKYGCEPSLTFFTTPVVVDNLLQEIVSDA